MTIMTNHSTAEYREDGITNGVEIMTELKYSLIDFTKRITFSEPALADCCFYMFTKVGHGHLHQLTF